MVWIISIVTWSYEITSAINAFLKFCLSAITKLPSALDPHLSSQNKRKVKKVECKIVAKIVDPIRDRVSPSNEATPSIANWFINQPELVAGNYDNFSSTLLSSLHSLVYSPRSVGRSLSYRGLSSGLWPIINSLLFSFSRLSLHRIGWHWLLWTSCNCKVGRPKFMVHTTLQSANVNRHPVETGGTNFILPSHSLGMVRWYTLNVTISGAVLRHSLEFSLNLIHRVNCTSSEQ